MSKCIRKHSGLDCVHLGSKGADLIFLQIEIKILIYPLSDHTMLLLNKIGKMEQVVPFKFSTEPSLCNGAGLGIKCKAQTTKIGQGINYRY